MPTWFESFHEASVSGKLTADYLDSKLSAWLAGRVYYSEDIYRNPDTQPPKLPGVYLWGSDQTVGGKHQLVLRRVGQSGWNDRKREPSEATLYKRLKQRYIPGPQGHNPNTEIKSQCYLADKHQEDISGILGDITNAEYLASMQEMLQRGVKAFPNRLIEAYRRRYRKSKKDDRLQEAVDFALHGGPKLTCLWVVWAECPRMERNSISIVEESLTKAAEGWNAARSLPQLI